MTAHLPGLPLECRRNPAPSLRQTGKAAAALTAQAAQGRELPAAVQQLPVSPHALGTFPFLNAPANYSYHFSDGIPGDAISEFGREYFAVDGKLYRQEGKVFKSTLEKARNTSGRFNQAQVEASYEQAIHYRTGWRETSRRQDIQEGTGPDR